MGRSLISGLIMLLSVGLVAALGACGTTPEAEASAQPTSDYEYIIGPGDILDVFVWRTPELSVTGVPVRPDGKVSSPLAEDMVAAGKTSTELAREIESVLSTYIKNPLVTVTIVGFVGGYQEQIRVVGEAASPQALTYRARMTVLDVMIAVGGLSEFAAGNKAKIVRKTADGDIEIRVRLGDLLNDGDVGQNVRMMPGDVLIIPQSFF